MSVIETERLRLREVNDGDASFIIELLNEPSFLQYIGDRGVRDTEDALRYIANGPADSYAKHGFGLWLVELRESNEPAGLCGLLKRDALPHPDIGFAFVPRHWSKGYALESARAVLAHAASALRIKRVLAITNQDNESSIKLLTKMGFTFDKLIRLPGETVDINLFVVDL